MSNLSAPTSADNLVDDGLAFPEVGSWAQDKHRKVGYYAQIFSESMKKKWKCRVFIDLFAGAGAARLKETGELVKGSPLVALGLSSPFDKYVFCEQDPNLFDALKKRTSQHHPDADAKVLNLDCNANIARVIKELPTFSREYTGISFCFVDPFKTKNLSFETIKTLSDAIYADFIVLLPTFMDINRNEHNYTKPDNPTLDTFLGETQWREDWKNNTSPWDFGLFIANRFGQQMKKLGYLYDGPDEYVTVRRAEDWSLYLYHLCFFSKSKLGKKFWKESRENTTVQRQLGI